MTSPPADAIALAADAIDLRARLRKARAELGVAAEENAVLRRATASLRDRVDILTADLEEARASPPPPPPQKGAVMRAVIPAAEVQQFIRLHRAFGNLGREEAANHLLTYLDKINLAAEHELGITRAEQP